MKQLEDNIIAVIKEIYDPEIPIDIYSLGLIYGIRFEELPEGKNKCIVDMTLTSPACPVAGTLVEKVKSSVEALDGIDEVKVKLTFTPPWTIDKVSEEGREIMEMEGTHIGGVGPS